MFENFKKEIETRADLGEDGVPELVEALLKEASRLRATDLHLDCRRDGAMIRVRIDGILYPVHLIQKDLMPNVVMRFKVMARVKTFDQRSPQDGRIEFAGEKGPIFLRASFLPTLHGEKVAIRFPDLSKLSFEIEDLGFSNQDLQRLYRFLQARQGTLLLTGPISSGKTTTIYSIIRRLVKEHCEGIAISTLEDPIEAEIEGVSQTQIDPVGGLDYASGLRMLLRQDTDVLVVGEIRDEETAHMAIRAGLVGRLVISTIHSPDAAGVFTRLINMDLEPFLITSSVAAVVGQRLMRHLCPSCKGKHTLSEEEARLLGWEDEVGKAVFAPRGCGECHQTGYRGRMGVFELLYMDEDLREMVLQKQPTRKLRNKAGEKGMHPLSYHAAGRVLAGETSLEEFARVLLPD